MTKLPPKLPDGFLIVDDREEVLRAIERFMREYFSNVFVAQTPIEAEREMTTHAPKMLLCDYWLGEKFAPATAYIPKWRRQFSSLRLVALMSGTNSSSLPRVAGIDEVFQKPLDMPRVVRFFSQ